MCPNVKFMSLSAVMSQYKLSCRIICTFNISQWNEGGGGRGRERERNMNHLWDSNSRKKREKIK